MGCEDVQYDVALSFAGEDREHAEAIAALLVDRGLRVFYDRYEQADLWGKDLYQHLQTVYRDRAQYCIVFASQHYADKLWTKHELRQAQARAFKENAEYILPLRLDDTEIPGINPTIAYIDLRQHNLIDIAGMICRKVQGDADALDRALWKGDTVIHNGMEVTAFWPKRVDEAQKIKEFPTLTMIARIPYGKEAGRKASPNRACHDCAVAFGQFHVPGCDWEQCPRCGGQLISCDCEIFWDTFMS
jgi:hypothetical protein